MKSIMGVDDRRFYWVPDTNQVMYTDDDELFGVIGFAESPQKAKDVVMQWL